MKKILMVVLVWAASPSTLFAQENNFKEDLSSYIGEVRQVNAFIAKMPLPASLLTKEGLEKARASMKAAGNVKTVLNPTSRTIAGPAGELRLVIFRPDTIRAVVLDIHGGGWCQGTADVDNAINDDMARSAQVAIVSVDYRLAPEAPFPACIEDCKAAARWLVANAKKEFGTDRIIISGNSAGAHLSAVTTLFIRDELKAIDKVIGVNLVYGLYDLGLTPSQRAATDKSFLPKSGMDDNLKLVFGSFSLAQLQRPEFSPLYADLKGMPPALFTVGAADPLADDTYFMEARWRMAGNKTFLAVYPESGHGVDIMPTKMARVARDRMNAWVRSICK